VTSSLQVTTARSDELQVRLPSGFLPCRKLGDLTLKNTTVSGGTGPVFGGLYISGGTTSVINRTISGNRGCGIGNSYGSLTLTNSRVSGNRGCGLDSAGDRNYEADDVAVTDSIISDNQGSSIVTLFSNLKVINSTISGNVASPNTSSSGGGLFLSNYGPTMLINSTVSGNSATGYGSGLLNGARPLTLTNSTNSCNSGARQGGGVWNGNDDILNLARTLNSGNTAASGAELFNNDDGLVTAASFSLFGHKELTNTQALGSDSCDDDVCHQFTPGPTDITATSNGNDPTALINILNPILANNGGPTRTHALVGGSPSIDTVTDSTCPPPNRDQRGVRRPQDGNNDGVAICDTGAF
jgi:hypothetical protein